MRPLPISLCIFDTSKGHFGRTDIYRRTVTDLAAQMPLNHFAGLFVHVKVAPGEESVFAEQQAFYQERGFTVLRSNESWKHFDVSHQQAYSRDLVTVYGHPEIQHNAYCLHLESDWLFRARKHTELVDMLAKSAGYLAANHTCVAVRFPRFLNEVERLNGLRAKHGMDVRTQREEHPWGAFIRHNDNLSLNPSLFRTRDLYAATRILKAHFAQLGNHVEMQFTHAFTHLADGALPWAIVDPAEFGVLHIGTREGEEDTGAGVYAS